MVWCWWGSWDGFGAGECPNLPQRRSGPGSAAKKSAEYQRFFSRAPARSGPLWQIWTIRRRRPAGDVCGPGCVPGGRPGERTGPAGRGAGLLVQPRTPKNAETCTLHSKVQFQPSLSSAKCTSRRGGAGRGRRGPRRRPRPGTSPVIRRERLTVRHVGMRGARAGRRQACVGHLFEPPGRPTRRSDHAYYAPSPSATLLFLVQ